MRTDSVKFVQVSTDELRDLVIDSVAYVMNKREQEKTESKETEKTKYLTRKEVSEMLDVSFSTLWRWERSQTLENYKVGGKVFYKEQDVEELINKNGSHEKA